MLRSVAASWADKGKTNRAEHGAERAYNRNEIYGKGEMD